MKLALFLLFFAGAAFGKTPNMDKLRVTGTALDRFLVSPTCSPTRSALMTGRSISPKSAAHIDVLPTLCGIPEK